jgi:hypothetical protein
LPRFEYGEESETGVHAMVGDALSLANAGGRVVLLDGSGANVDMVVYADGAASPPDWKGKPVRAFDFGGTSKEGQVLYRKLREKNGMPVRDTNRRKDWAQDPNDERFGKRVRYPGWEVERFFQTVKSRQTATVKYCVAPDHLYECVRDEIRHAERTIEIEMYSLDSPQLTRALIKRLKRGVKVSLLLDGSAMEAQGKWACQQLEAEGGECWLMASKPQANIHKRFANQHGKWMVIDDARVLIGSENIGADSMPADDKADGTYGARGGYLVTNNRKVVRAVEAIMQSDFDPANYSDVRRWGTNADDFPPVGFTPTFEDGGRSYKRVAPLPFERTGAFPIELVQCPENCLRVSDGLLGMVGKAGQGDTVLVTQLYERAHWGGSKSTAERDPNVRLEAYIAAARRGATVRILLDSFYDNASIPRSNVETCAHVNALPALLDIECRLGNPTGRGIHIKMALVKRGATGIVHLGSINGSETSNKLNRELAAQVESLAAYEYWKMVFESDWARGYVP